MCIRDSGGTTIPDFVRPVEILKPGENKRRITPTLLDNTVKTASSDVEYDG